MEEQALQQRMPTGMPGLDHLLEGGLVRGNSLLIEGPPGSGKTTFAIRAIHEGIVRYGEPGLIVTFEEFPKQIYQEALGYGVDLARLEEEGKLRVIWTLPSRILEAFSGKNDLLESIITELGVRRVVIDSITHFRRVAQEEHRLRELLGGILNYLKMKRINAFLVKELDRLDEGSVAFEEFLVDASMRVYNTRSPAGGENMRYVEIRKTRGQGHISGKHPFRLSERGIEIYPNLRPEDIRSTCGQKGPSKAHKVPIGLPDVDGMLEGGLWNGSLNIVDGASGTGKSVLSYHFLHTALAAGEPCLLVTLRESPRRILHQARSLGMDWSEQAARGKLEILEILPVAISLEEVLNRVHDKIREQRPGRLVLDSVGDLAGLTPDEDRLRSALRVLGEMADSTGATTLVLTEMGSLSSSQERRVELTDLASCVIQLSLVDTDGELRRFFGIRKHAGTDHAKELREFHIDSCGFRLKRKATGMSGIFSGVARGSLTDVADKVIPAIDEISQAIRALEKQAAPSEDARKHIRTVRARLGLVDVLLREHFGITEFHKMAEELLEEMQESDPTQR